MGVLKLFLDKFTLRYVKIMMMRKKLLISIFILIVIIATLNALAVEYFLYWKFWWYDIIMHFLGGIWVGLSSLWISFYSGYFKKIKQTNFNIFLISLISVVLVGFGWEIFEFLIKSNAVDGYFFDTIIDIMMDILGSLFASFVLLSLNNKF